MPEVTIPLLPKQRKFIRALARMVLYSGAWGAGKTRALCYRIVHRVAGRPGAREGLVRKTNVALKRTTLHTLLNQDGDNPPVLPEGTYEHWESKQLIRLNGGGEIVYFGIDTPTKIGSTQLTGCGIDEWFELTEQDTQWLNSRCRVKLTGLVNQIYGATNPDSPSHHLARIFGLSGGKPEPNTFAVQSCSLDNPYLPEDYVAWLKSLTGLSYKRYVLGQWAGSDRLVYDTWDRAVFVKARPETGWKRTIIGVDAGYTNPGVMLVIREDGDGRIHVASETYKRKWLQKQWVNEAFRLSNLYAPVEAFAVDPSAADLIAALRNAGHNVIAAKNDRLEGVNNVRARLVVPDDGKPRLTVDPECENTIREIETYENKTDRDGNATDEPSKADDHAPDALRYGCMSLKAPPFKRSRRYGMD